MIWLILKSHNLDENMAELKMFTERKEVSHSQISSASKIIFLLTISSSSICTVSEVTFTFYVQYDIQIMMMIACTVIVVTDCR